QIRLRFAIYIFREACGLPPVPQSEKVQRWLVDNSAAAASILDANLRSAPSLVFDLGVGSRFLGADPRAVETCHLTEALFGEMKRAGVPVGVGRYSEARRLYTSPLFGASANPTDERRTIHLGMDLFVEAGSPVYAPLDGVVHTLADNSPPMEYCPLVFLRHTDGHRAEIVILNGHLPLNHPPALRPVTPA